MIFLMILFVIIAIYTDDTTLYYKCDRASYLLQQPDLASELGFDLRDTVDLYRKQFVDFNVGKTQLVLFDRFNNMDGSVLEKKSSFKLMGLTFSSKLDWGSHIISIAKLPPRKFEL